MQYFSCLLSADHHCELLEYKTGHLRAELLHRSQAFHHSCYSGRRHCNADTRCASLWYTTTALIVFVFRAVLNVLHIVYICVQEKLKICPTHLRDHRHLLERLDLHFTTGFGLMMDGNSLFCPMTGFVLLSMLLSCFGRNLFNLDDKSAPI